MLLLSSSSSSSQHHIWDYFSPVSLQPKHAVCLACEKTLEKGTELTAAMKAPNLKHHLKTVHPDLYAKYQQSLKQNKVMGSLKSARGERLFQPRKKYRINDEDQTEDVRESCHSCSRKEAGQTFITKNEFSYCTDCYQRIFTKNCDAAESGTEKNHHQEKRFKCVVCEVRLEAGEAEGLLCAQCARPALCWQCGESITDRDLGLRRRGRAWHQRCLQCSHCHSVLAGLSFTWREDQPYCLPCINTLFSKPCQACPQPIHSGGVRFISLDGRYWHSSCFLCTVCSTSLVDTGFIAQAGQIICQDCAENRAAQ